jgi:hypothetical protein
MSNKKELAALMASDGDYEKKISLLKKAVVTVTKQKQDLEGKQTELQEELRSATQRLMELQRENTALQRKVKSLETQLEQERGSGGSAFGQNMLKGLSSIMGSSDARGRGGGGGGRGAGRGGSGMKLALSAEDVERLVTENEQLHREKYTYKTKLEDFQRAATKDADKLRAEVAQLQRDLAELHGTLDIVTGRCDRLNADYLMERAVGDFCRHFFAAALHYSKEETTCGSTTDGVPVVVVELRWPASPRPQITPLQSPSPPFSTSVQQGELFSKEQEGSGSARSSADLIPVEVRETVVNALQSSYGTIKTLLRGVFVLIVVLREQLPLRERATVGDLECLRDRLSVFLDAHTIKKDRLMFLLEQLETSLAKLLPQDSDRADHHNDGDPLTSEMLAEVQDEVLQLLIDWVGLLRAQTPLLVESCVSFLPQGHTYALHVGRRAGSSAAEGAASATASPACTTTDRAEFVEEVTKHGCATLASVEGSLVAARALLQRSPTAYRSSALCSGSGCRADDDKDDNNGGGGEAAEGRSLLFHGASPPTVQDACALLAVQQFWWEGCTAVRALHAAASALDDSVQDLAEACNKSEVRDALQYLSKCLRSVVAASAASAEGLGEKVVDAALGAVQPARCFHGSRGSSTSVAAPIPQPPPTSSARGGEPPARDHRASPLSLTPASAEAYEEVLVALAAADRAAATYHTQMNYLYMEMADKEDALQTTLEAMQQMRKLLDAERAEAEHTRLTMQRQISVLSNQLIEMTEAAQATARQH